MNRIEAEKEHFNKVNFKEFPLRRNEIEAFRYLSLIVYKFNNNWSIKIC